MVQRHGRARRCVFSGGATATTIFAKTKCSIPLLQSIADGPNGNGIPSNPYLAFGDPTDEGAGAGSLNEMGVRAALRWKPIDRITLDGTYELFQNNSPAAPLTVRSNPYRAFLDMPMTLDQRTEGVRAVAAYEEPDLFSLQYSFGWTRYEHTSTVDLDAGVHRYRTPAYGGAEETQFFYDAPFANDSMSHEVQLRSEWDFPIKALAGYFNFKEDTNRNLWVDIPQAAGGVILFNQPSRVAKSQAVFGEVSWDITPRWELKAGLRYSMDQKTDTNGSRSDTFPGGWPASVRLSGLGRAGGPHARGSSGGELLRHQFGGIAVPAIRSRPSTGCSSMTRVLTAWIGP